MRNKLTYVAFMALFGGYIATFTSCVNGVDDEYLELQNTGEENGSGDKQPETEYPNLNGDYVNGGDNDLTMTYNGAPLSGRKVTVLTDEKDETATLTLAGNEVDLSSAIGGLLDFKITPYSPIPGEKEVVLQDVKLYGNKNKYIFSGENVQPTRTVIYKGSIEEGKVNIDLTCQLANTELQGTWDLAPVIQSGGGTTMAFSPLWSDWDSNVTMDLGHLSFLDLKKPFKDIWSIIAGPLSGTLLMKNIIGQSISTEPLVANLLKSLTAHPSGSMGIMYSYSDDFANPQWSDNLPDNFFRYYYGETPGKLYVEVDPNAIANLLGGLLSTRSLTRSDPENAKRIGQELISMLTPVIEAGVPIEYTLDGNELTINLDGVLVRDLIGKLLELANDEYVMDYIQQNIQALLGDFTPNILSMLQTMPNAVKYHDGDSESTYTGECAYIKFGLKLVKAN
ncbi:MAG: DUF4925 domain-containing protein [Mediterranea sp.]|jgi:hypothetical protein|nr:DUF4925 domain-containing protein [Mediterranea sp.]